MTTNETEASIKIERIRFFRVRVYDLNLDDDKEDGKLLREEWGWYGRPEGESETRILTREELVKSGKHPASIESDKRSSACEILLSMALSNVGRFTEHPTTASNKDWSLFEFIKTACEKGWPVEEAEQYIVANEQSLLDSVRMVLTHVDLSNSIEITPLSILLQKSQIRKVIEPSFESRMIKKARISAKRRYLINFDNDPKTIAARERLKQRFSRPADKPES